jgi:hypothetical protein
MATAYRYHADRNYPGAPPDQRSDRSTTKNCVCGGLTFFTHYYIVSAGAHLLRHSLATRHVGRRRPNSPITSCSPAAPGSNANSIRLRFRSRRRATITGRHPERRKWAGKQQALPQGAVSGPVREFVPAGVDVELPPSGGMEKLEPRRLIVVDTFRNTSGAATSSAVDRSNPIPNQSVTPLTP